MRYGPQLASRASDRSPRKTKASLGVGQCPSALKAMGSRSGRACQSSKEPHVQGLFWWVAVWAFSITISETVSFCTQFPFLIDGQILSDRDIHAGALGFNELR